MGGVAPPLGRWNPLSPSSPLTAHPLFAPPFHHPPQGLCCREMALGIDDAADREGLRRAPGRLLRPFASAPAPPPARDAFVALEGGRGGRGALGWWRPAASGGYRGSDDPNAKVAAPCLLGGARGGCRRASRPDALVGPDPSLPFQAWPPSPWSPLCWAAGLGDLGPLVLARAGRGRGRRGGASELTGAPSSGARVAAWLRAQLVLPLHMWRDAGRLGHVADEARRRRIRAGPDAAPVGVSGPPWPDTPLHAALTTGAPGALAAARWLIDEAGASLERVGHRGDRPLHRAVLASAAPRGDGVAAVALLLRAGARVDGPADDGATPLAWAASLGRCEAASLLLAAGADVECADPMGRTPLFRAAAARRYDVVAVLLSSGGRVRRRDAARVTPLVAAARGAALQGAFASVLPPRLADDDGDTDPAAAAVLAAADAAAAATCRLLIAAGARVNVSGER